MNVAVFAGVFDPVHKGHEAVVRKALDDQFINSVVVVAEKAPQHKNGTAPYQHRHAMLEIVFSGMAHVEVLESPVSKHYIKPFFLWLQARYPEATFTWIVGSDVLSHMITWPDIKLLPELRVDEILCFYRDSGAEDMPDKVAFTKVRYMRADKATYTISSRKIREGKLEFQQSVDSKVAAYSSSFKLYKNAR